jgi:nucleoside-diphosphate-sugar epimerase
MDVLVIGGTRFLGPWVVKGLYEKGHTLTLLHRGQTEVALPPEIAHLHGDRKDLLHFRERFKEHLLMDNMNDRRRRIIFAAHWMERSDDYSVCAKR